MSTTFRTLIDHLRTVVGREGLAAASDADLLNRYVADRDELAFAELVHRHAPLVYAVCRRYLPASADLDDAFQATFIVLARKAGSLARPDRLAGWLGGVADRIARRARVRAARRSSSERPLASAPEPSVTDAVPVADLRAVLAEELARLPAEYRQAVQLCDVDGVARRAAAEQLGIPDSTLNNRLARARELLGRRLVRRGVALGTGVGSFQLADASVPVRLISLAVRQVFQDPVPAGITALVMEGLPPMILTKKLIGPLIVLAVMGTATVGVIVLIQRSTPPTNPTQTAATRVVTPTTRAVPRDQLKPRPWTEPQFGERIADAAYTSDGKRAVVLQSHKRPYPSEEGGYRLFVYDTTTWNPIHTLDLPDVSEVGPMAMTPDGKRVFLGWESKAVYQWEPGGTKPEQFFELGPEQKPSLNIIQIQNLKLSPDGKSLAMNLQFVEKGHLVGQGIRIWSTESGDLVGTVPVRPSEKDWYVWPTLRFTDNGRTVAILAQYQADTPSRYELIEYNLAGREEKKRIDLSAALGSASGKPHVHEFIYTPDDKQIVITGGYELNKRKWGSNDAKGPVMDELKSHSYGVWVIDRGTGQVIKPLVEHRSHNAHGLGLSHDGKKLMVRITLPSRMDRDHGGWNWDHEFLEVQQWDVATWQQDWVKIIHKTDMLKEWALFGR